MIVHLSVAGIILPCSCFSFNCRVETLLKQALRYSHLVKSCKYASSRLHAHVHPEWRGCGKMALIASGWQHLSGTYLIHLKLKPQRGRGLQGPIIKFHGVDFSKKNEGSWINELQPKWFTMLWDPDHKLRWRRRLQRLLSTTQMKGARRPAGILPCEIFDYEKSVIKKGRFPSNV